MLASPLNLFCDRPRRVYAWTNLKPEWRRDQEPCKAGAQEDSVESWKGKVGKVGSLSLGVAWRIQMLGGEVLRMSNTPSQNEELLRGGSHFAHQLLDVPNWSHFAF